MVSSRHVFWLEDLTSVILSPSTVAQNKSCLAAACSLLAVQFPRSVQPDCERSPQNSSVLDFASKNSD